MEPTGHSFYSSLRWIKKKTQLSTINKIIGLNVDIGPVRLPKTMGLDQQKTGFEFFGQNPQREERDECFS